MLISLLTVCYADHIFGSQKVGFVQRKELNQWIEANPNWENDSSLQEEYMTLVSKSMGDLNENNNDNKIIKKICNQAYIGSDNK